MPAGSIQIEPFPTKLLAAFSVAGDLKKLVEREGERLSPQVLGRYGLSRLSCAWTIVQDGKTAAAGANKKGYLLYRVPEVAQAKRAIVGLGCVVLKQIFDLSEEGVQSATYMEYWLRSDASDEEHQSTVRQLVETAHNQSVSGSIRAVAAVPVGNFAYAKGWESNNFKENGRSRPLPLVGADVDNIRNGNVSVHVLTRMYSPADFGPRIIDAWPGQP